MTDRMTAFNTYAKARAELSARQLVGFTPSWPDRPPWIPDPLTEADVAALAEALRVAWREDVPDDPGPPITPEPDPPDGRDFGWVAFDHDIESVIAYVDREIEKAIAGLAMDVVKSHLNANKEWEQ
jgi:hypothetical protein